MDLDKKLDVVESKSSGFKVRILDGEKEIGRAFLYLLYNDLHSRPFGFVEDVFLDSDYRGHNLGKDIMEKIVGTARENNCYKIIFTSRLAKERLHNYYEKQGFGKWGYEFRMDLD